ncbi:siroheme synthase CysG [Aristophania vespae]|uniref:siroheme synthase CysG n=1 Tax=Aristophania vespae TaxID=2697033 RepID=UPI0023510DC8|nr:siroheme synthase CysG [Aristophania vespae]UMM64124.1 Siroheme synthase [Aristophania vespae]
MKTLSPYLPLAFRLDTISVLIIGGGVVALNKLRLFLGRGCIIHVWAKDVHSEIKKAYDDGKISLHIGPFSEKELDRFFPDIGLIFAATDKEEINLLISEKAFQYRVPVCVVDNPALSSFITPAFVNRDPVQIAITSGGASPVLARRLRQKIEAELPTNLGQAAQFMQAQRSWLKEKIPHIEKRRHIWESFIDSAHFEDALAGDYCKAKHALEALVNNEEKQGEVWLVGAGPGHADLLTLAALRLMQNADSVLYDNLVSDEVLDRVRRDAERVYVGKERSKHSLPQEDIHKELSRRAKRGERVLRLKGGDPFIFGRGGEEMEALLKEGISVRVVPGVTAANGCGASAGIPLTHRDCAQSCIFLTGHARADGSLNLYWPSLARKGQTLVIYMGLAPLETLCDQLIKHGLPATWPIAVIEKGTCSDERVVTGQLRNIAAKVQAENIKSPALLIVGEVVLHRAKTNMITSQFFAPKEGAL